MGMEKGLCLLDGRPLIEYSVKILEQVCDSIIIGANAGPFDYLGLEVIPDEISNIGPLAGIYTCLKHSETNDNLVLSCDIPLIPADLLRKILSEKHDYQVIIPLSGGLPEPLCAFYRKDILPVVENAITLGRYKIQDAIKETRHRFLNLDYEEHPAGFFSNINTPADLAKMEQYLKQNPKTR